MRKLLSFGLPGYPDIGHSTNIYMVGFARRYLSSSFLCVICFL